MEVLDTLESIGYELISPLSFNPQGNGVECIWTMRKQQQRRRGWFW